MPALPLWLLLTTLLLPLEEVIAVAGVARVPNANPLFQVLFQYLPEGAGRAAVELVVAALKPFDEGGVGLSHAKLDLSYHCWWQAPSWQITWLRCLMPSPWNVFLEALYLCLSSWLDNVGASALGGSLLGPRDAMEAARLSMGEERPEYLSAPLVHEAFAGCGCQVP